MKFITTSLLLCLSVVLGYASSLEERIVSEAMIVTKSELRRHMAAGEDDSWRPATYSDLAASRGDNQPDYLVVRFRTTVLGHYSGEAEAILDGALNGVKLNVTLHFNKGWVEYFIPMDGVMHRRLKTQDGPKVDVVWNDLRTK